MMRVSSLWLLKRRKPAGGTFGYEPIPRLPGVYQANKDQADIVRLIYRLYVAGQAPRTISGAAT